jgi:hypothetical protein
MMKRLRVYKGEARTTVAKAKKTAPEKAEVKAEPAK